MKDDAEPHAAASAAFLAAKSISSDAHATIVIFLNEGIDIQATQYVFSISKSGDHPDCLHRTKLAHTLSSDHQTGTSSNTVEQQSEALSLRIHEWRKVQKKLMPEVGDLVQETSRKSSSESSSSVTILRQKLYLPSEIPKTNKECNSENIKYLGSQEVILRTGQAFDAVTKTCNACKAISTIKQHRKKHDSGQSANTRSLDALKSLERSRDYHIKLYNNARQSMISLGHISNDDPKFPLLSEKDTFRKPTTSKRELGASSVMDGPIWQMNSSSSRPRYTPLEDTSPGMFSTCISFLTLTRTISRYGKVTNPAQCHWHPRRFKRA